MEQKKFKCLACGQKFEANDRGQVICPHCHSDNVTPNKTNFAKPLGLAVIILLGLGIGIGVSLLKKHRPNPADIVGDSIPDSIPVPIPAPAIEKGDSLYLADLMGAISITTTSPKMDKSNKYSFKATVASVPNDVAVSYMLCETYGNKVIKKSDDGSFNGINPSANDINSYKLLVILQKNGSQVQLEKDIMGFLPPPPPPTAEPITAQEIQSYINKHDAEALGGSNKKIAHSVHIRATGLQEDDFPPETLADILQRLIIGQWSSVKVTGVGYNANNQLNSLNISVTY